MEGRKESQPFVRSQAACGAYMKGRSRLGLAWGRKWSRILITWLFGVIAFSHDIKNGLFGNINCAVDSAAAGGVYGDS